MKDTTYTIRMSSKLKKKCYDLAFKDGRTLANWINQLLKEKIMEVKYGKDTSRISQQK